MRTSEVLRKAVDVLYERGHCKHYLRNDRGEVCARGAVFEVLTGDACAIEGTGETWVAEAAAMIALNAAIDTTDKPVPERVHPVQDAVNRVVWWNNRPERTFDEVIDGFERAAKLAEQNETEDQAGVQ